ELVLEPRQNQRILEGHVLAHRDLALARAQAGLRRDEDRAVRRARAVERGRVRALQHRDRRDVVRVDVHRRVTPVQVVRTDGRRAVVDRNAVDDEPRLVAARDRVRTADDDAPRATRARRLRDVHAGNLAGQCTHDVRLDRRKLVTTDRLRRHTDRGLLPLDAERRDDNAVVADFRLFPRQVRRYRLTRPPRLPPAVSVATPIAASCRSMPSAVTTMRSRLTAVSSSAKSAVTASPATTVTVWLASP